MKKAAALILGVFLMGISAKAASNAAVERNLNNFNGSSYIFVEQGVEFSVFPDGQFDFVYLGADAEGVNVNVSAPGVNVSFNGGYNYDAYVQYDDYGAVIQVETVPIFYDEFGRIIQAGDVEIRYTNRRLVRVGGLRIFYNRFGAFDYCTGFVSPFYRTYVYRPWHVFYARPFFNSCIVYDYPYRRFYTPFRYSFAYHRTYWRSNRAYINGRREFHRPGSRVHYRDGRTAVNRSFNPNRRNTAVSQSPRRETRPDRNSTTTLSRGNRGTVTRGDNNALGSTRGTLNRPSNNSVTSSSDRNKPNRGIVSRDRKQVNRNGLSTRNRTEGKRVQRNRPGKDRGTIAQNSSRKSSRSISQKQNRTTRATTNRSSVNRKSSSTKQRSSYKPNKRSSVQRESYKPQKRSSVKRNSNTRSTRSTVKRNSSSRNNRGSTPRRGRGI